MPTVLRQDNQRFPESAARLNLLRIFANRQIRSIRGIAMLRTKTEGGER